MAYTYHYSRKVDLEADCLYAEGTLADFTYHYEHDDIYGVTLTEAKIGLASLNRERLVEMFGADAIHDIECWVVNYMLEDGPHTERGAA